MMILVDALKTMNIDALASDRSDLKVHFKGSLKKISGSAFKQKKDRSIHHGTMLINTDLDKLNFYLESKHSELDAVGVKSVRSHVCNITDINFTAHLNLIVETVPAESGIISGEVTFSGNWPTETVFISLNSLWPLQTTPNYYSTIASNNLIDSKYSYSFENITFGTYIIAVVWLNPSGNWNTLGAYGSVTSPDFENAELVTITATDFELTDLDFTAIFSD